MSYVALPQTRQPTEDSDLKELAYLLVFARGVGGVGVGVGGGGDQVYVMLLPGE